MKKSFSLAELLISLLVISIIIAVSMPTVTRKNSKVEHVWRYTKGVQQNIFAAVSDYQKALLGTIGDEYINKNAGKLSILKPLDSSYPDISFFTKDSTTGAIKHEGILSFDNNNIVIGNEEYLTGNMSKEKGKTLKLDGNFYAQDVFVMVGNLFGGSDKRLKENISNSTIGLNEINKIQVKNYNYKNDKTPRVGVIAQDLQKIFPNSVKKNEDGFLAVSKDEMFFAMINSIQELDKRIIELEKENKELKSKLNEMVK